MRHNINGEDWISWSDVEKYYKNKVIKDQLDRAVRVGVVRTKTLPVKGTSYVFDVYAEADVQLAVANHKFGTKIDVDWWFK